MSWAFESELKYTRFSDGKCMVAVSELEVWVGWADGLITWHCHRNDPQYLTENFYFSRPIIPFTGDTTTGVVQSTNGNVTYSGTPLYMVKWYDSVYVMTATTIFQFNIATRKLIDYTSIAPLSLPGSTGSSLCAADGKLWVTGFNTNSTKQQLLWSIPVNSYGSASWSSVVLPGRHQTTTRKLLDGLDGKLYVTNMNNHGIIAVDTNTNTIISSYTINRHPYGLAVNQNKEIYVMSDAGSTINQGMIHLFSQPTGTSSPFCAACGDSDIVLDDLRTGYLWIAGGTDGRSTRLQKSDQYIVTTGTKGAYDPVSIVPSINTTGDAYIVGTDSSLRVWDGKVFNISTGPALDTLNVKGKVATVDELPTPSLPDNITLEMLNAQHAVMTEELTFDYYNPDTGTTTSHITRPYLYVLNKTELVAYRLTSLVRVNSCSVLGTAMISIGDQSYFGD